MDEKSSLVQFMLDQEENDFTPERMRDAARLLRLIKSPKNAVLAKKYAVMLERLAKFEQTQRDLIKKQFDRVSYNHFDEDQ